MTRLAGLGRLAPTAALRAAVLGAAAALAAVVLSAAATPAPSGAVGAPAPAGAAGAPVSAPADTPAAPDGTSTALAPIVAAWPDAWTATGTKAEPLYTERIAIARDGDDYSVRIEVLSQGQLALGVQESAVRVAADGTVAWTAGCPKDAASCADDPALRGFLAAAVLPALDRAGALPEAGALRTVHGVPVVCVADAALHPDAPPAVVRLDPCFTLAEGAVVAHWSPGSAAFVGATLAPGLDVRPGAPTLLPQHSRHPKGTP